MSDEKDARSYLQLLAKQLVDDVEGLKVSFSRIVKVNGVQT